MKVVSQKKGEMAIPPTIEIVGLIAVVFMNNYNFSKEIMEEINRLIKDGQKHSVPNSNKKIADQWKTVFNKLGIKFEEQGEYLYLKDQEIYAHPTIVRYARPWEYLEKVNSSQRMVLNLRDNGVFDLYGTEGDLYFIPYDEIENFNEEAAVKASEPALAKCRKCGKYFFLSMEGSFKCPLCGEHDGDHHLEYIYYGEKDCPFPTLMSEKIWDNLGLEQFIDPSDCIKRNKKDEYTYRQMRKTQSIVKLLKVPTPDEEWNGIDEYKKKQLMETFPESLDPKSDWYQLDPAPKEFVGEYIYRYGYAYDLAKEESWNAAAKNDSRVFCVYRHVSPSGKSYIGVTSQSPEDRWQNGWGYKGQGFWNAIKKYGWANFEHYVYTDEGLMQWPLQEGQTIKYVALNEARKLEQHLINKYNSYYNGYNRSKGGEITREIQNILN